jgi:predicted MPP superfamily phosphohydrolase
MIEHLLFSQFFTVLAVAGGLAQWLLVCWLGAPLGFVAPPWLHVLAPATLALANRRAARAVEGGPSRLSGSSGRGLLASAFAAIMGAGTLGVCTVAWIALASLGVLPADAGAAAALATPAFDPGFRIVSTLAVLLAGGAVAHGYLRGQHALGVTELTVPLDNLPAPLVGLRIAHVSDLHVGTLADRAALRDALARVVALDPDVIVVTGDLVDDRAADLDAWMPELAVLKAPHGVFTILGNHDRHVGTARVIDALRRHTDWRLLRDEVATITIDGARLHLAGLEDRPRSQAADGLPALLAEVPQGEPSILLAHRPTLFPAAAEAGVRLMLCGHTHGGQIAVPGLPRLNPARILMTGYDAGTFRRDGAVLHVSRGLGVSGQPLRVAVPREITIVTLAATA